MAPDPSAPVDAAPDGGHWAMPAPGRGRPWVVPTGITLVWAAWVLVGGHVDRVAGHWEAALTVAMGSIVAGATPLGGAAVGFGPLTKVLDIAAAPARTLSLAVQAVGLGAAAVMAGLSGRRLHWDIIGPVIGGGAVGMVLALALLTDRASAFGESLVPAPHVAVVFTTVVVVTSLSALLAMRARASAPPAETGPGGLALTIAALLGGAVAGLTGSGVDAVVVLVVLAVAGRHPQVGLPTAIVAMAIVAAVGTLALVVVEGQFAVDLDAVGQVVAVGGQPTPPLEAARYDLFGLFLAAAPVAAWVVPLAAHLAARASRRAMAAAVATLGVVELASTALTLQALREDTTVRAVALIGVPAAIALVGLAGRRGARRAHIAEHE